MEDGQLQLLLHHVGDFVNNYTGMTLTINANHDLDRFQSLACFPIKELQDNLYFQKYSFPDTQTTFSLCAEHIRCGCMWLRNNFVWLLGSLLERISIGVKLLLGHSYGVVIKDIVDEIQQDNIGQYIDVGYLLSLTATMRALLYEYSSSTEDFTLDYDTTVYTPRDMTKA